MPSATLQGEAFEVAKKINLEYTITIPQYVIDDLIESEVTNNPFLSDVRVYISDDGSIRGDKYYLQLTELGLEIQCNKNI